jgi:hypothetical protein
MASKGYLPSDNPAVRARVQMLVLQGSFGVPQRAAVLGDKVFNEFRDGLPQWLRACLDQDHGAMLEVTRKGCRQIAEEELARAVLRIGKDRKMTGMRGIRVQAGKDVYYLKVAQLLLTLDDQRAIVARYDRQIAALRTERAHAQFCLDVHERHPEAATCGEALQLEGLQYEMVFEDAS